MLKSHLLIFAQWTILIQIVGNIVRNRLSCVFLYVREMIQDVSR